MHFHRSLAGVALLGVFAAMAFAGAATGAPAQSEKQSLTEPVPGQLTASKLQMKKMGTARMGRDAKSSVLNGRNQVWDCLNVFVTDGACMTSSGCQNPSLAYMALTARAAAFAVDELKRGNL